MNKIYTLATFHESRLISVPHFNQSDLVKITYDMGESPVINFQEATFFSKNLGQVMRIDLPLKYSSPEPARRFRPEPIKESWFEFDCAHLFTFNDVQFLQEDLISQC